MYYYINIGSNIGERKSFLRQAVAGLWEVASRLWTSTVVESEPWGFESPNPFLNQGVMILTDLAPEQLLAFTKALEQRLSSDSHRNSDGSYRDRNIDIDIICGWNNGKPLLSDTPELTLPHPRAEEREFVMKPLSELLEHQTVMLHEGRVALPFPRLEQCVGATLERDCEWTGIRDSWAQLGDEAWSRVARQAELEYWDKETRYCGHCGAAMTRTGENSKRCPECGCERFPRLSPAILVLVKRGEEALLVHAANFRAGMYALVAGFVETGESLEECVAREVKEETGMEVVNIRYFGSQSWPFPAQMMVGFTAEWKSGEPRWVDGELTAGGFFRPDAVPTLPTEPSLSRRIIDAWLSGK